MPGPQPGKGRFGDYTELAAIARQAHANGQRMAAVLAATYGLTERAASAHISRARKRGHAIPSDRGANQLGGVRAPANLHSAAKAKGGRPKVTTPRRLSRPERRRIALTTAPRFGAYLPGLDLERIDWTGARCAGRTDEMFPTTPDGVQAAKVVCEYCPVGSECLTYALVTNQRHGVWGGRSEAWRTYHRARILRAAEDWRKEGAA